MIVHGKRQVFIESGNGTVESYWSITEDGIGVICLNEGEKSEIGICKPIDGSPEPCDSAVVWAFKNIESLDVSIKVFNELREMMVKYQNGELDFKEAT